MEGSSGRVAEGSGLENRRGCKPSVGSNPTCSEHSFSQDDPPSLWANEALSKPKRFFTPSKAL